MTWPKASISFIVRQVHNFDPSPLLSPSLITLFALASCDQGFDPALEQEKYFSIFGVLDLDADTQWIRVMPIRSSAQSSSGEVDATVTVVLPR